jgi:hypothetical protein
VEDGLIPGVRHAVWLVKPDDRWLGLDARDDGP